MKTIFYNPKTDSILKLLKQIKEPTTLLTGEYGLMNISNEVNNIPTGRVKLSSETLFSKLVSTNIIFTRITGVKLTITHHPTFDDRKYNYELFPDGEPVGSYTILCMRGDHPYLLFKAERL